MTTLPDNGDLFPTNHEEPPNTSGPRQPPSPPPSTAEANHQLEDYYFAFRTPDTPPFAYFQPVPTPTTASTDQSASIATPSSTRQSRPFGQALTPTLPLGNATSHVSPPQTSRSAALSTASSAPHFAFRPPSEPDPARLSWSRGHLQTRILSPDSTSPNTGLQTHWEHPSPPSTRATDLQAVTDIEKPFDFSHLPESSWSDSQNVDSLHHSSPTPASPNIPKLSASGEKLPEYAQEHVQPTSSLPLDENPLYIEDLEEDSPYPEVRASVSNADDPEMLCLTFRMWAVGLALCLIMNAANMYLYLRSPSPYITAPATVILGYAGGRLLAATLPIRSWTIAGYEFSLNPGPFNIKEHALIYILAGIIINTSPVPYGMGAVIVWDKRYMQPLRTGFTFLFLISSQLIGFGLVGLCRQFFIYPASAIWPTNLAVSAMLNTLHAENDVGPDRKGLSRLRLFFAATAISCLWVFLPGYLFTAFSYFSFICWIWPRNVVVNQLFGSVSGLGLNVLTFDWSQVTWIGSPLIIPFWAQVHTFASFVILYWILAPILYYTNVWNSGHLPLMGGSGYDRFAKPYNLTRVFDRHTTRFNVTAYEEYSPLYLPISFALTYLLAFAIPPALVMHTALYYGPVAYRLVKNRKRPEDEKDDVHAKLMRHYPEVPHWWYLSIFTACLALSVGAAFVQPDLDVPVSSIILAILLAILLVIPECYLQAIAGQTAAINLLPQVISGALWPEKPMTNMESGKKRCCGGIVVFKVYTISTASVGASFVQALKLGHYMKVPPKFLVVGVFVSTVFQIGVKQLIFEGVEDVCEPGQSARLVCAHSQVFYTASIVWGLIGPKRQFGKGGVYYGPIYAVIAGAVLPVLFWWWNRRSPGRSWLRRFNVAVAVNGPTWIPPATGVNYSSWFAYVDGTLCDQEYFLRTRRYRWWSRYNYVLAGALDSGTAIGIILCFLILQLPKRGALSLKWWGNTVWQNTADGRGVPFYDTDPVLGF
ncbi:hypothetical protein M407DRAFT_21934 [Tulasnella calospora MUT 4182]|uniref:OPT family small oligopeptide transporter n=1 Tax=Tulasnella calospora MUT 4182 TaxID=1051891 RepID=A0A0C3QD84_9AGAM|nr:hypothetical protein M407DRAFT_21934 [Tulasnella calospora MUT 4182]